MGTLLDRIAGHAFIGLDSSPFIYYFERNPDWFSVVADLFVEAANSTESILLCTSGITLAEVLVMPIRSNRTDLYERYTTFFFEAPFVRLFDVSNEVLLGAAALRATYGLRAADAIQIASCIENGCEVFVTNDKRLQKVKEIEVIVLADCDPPTVDK